MPPESNEQPPAPNPLGFDWIRLVSGEWLKGEILILRNRSMQFDSDELDEQEFDWEKVVEVRSPRNLECLFVDKTSARGTLLIRDDFVLVGGERVERFAREDLLTIVPGGQREINYWSGKVSLGYSNRSGNTNQVDLNMRSKLQRRTLESNWSLEYTGNYSEVEGEEISNDHRAGSSYTRFISESFYATPLGVEYYRDVIQNIRHQVSPYAVMGYHIFAQPDIEWDVELGGGYRYTRYDSVLATEDDYVDYGVLVGATRLEADLTKDIDLEVSYRTFVGVSSDGSTDQNFYAILSIELTDVLDLDVGFYWDRIGSPERDENGARPNRDDFRTTVSLSLDF